jgi:glucose/arabinose dehydrogenase
MRGFILAALLSAAWMGPAHAQQRDDPLRGQAAFGDWRDDKPGTWRLIRPDDLPKPFATESASNGADEIAAPANAAPLLPEGFSATRLVSGLRSPRVVRVAPNGDLFVADSRANRVRVYRLEGDGTMKEKGVFTQGLRQPYGIAFHPLDKPEWV